VFVAETLVHALDELKRAYEACRKDPEFVAEFEYELKHYVGRPSPVYHAKRWSQRLGGAQIYIKREDLNHTGPTRSTTPSAGARREAHGQTARDRRDRRRNARVAAATVAARYGMECVVYMGSEDIRRQVQNVYRMKLLGAAVVRSNRDRNVEGRLERSDAGLGHPCRRHLLHHRQRRRPHPYPMMVRDFQSVIGRECLVQMPELCGRQPDAVIACVGGLERDGHLHALFRTKGQAHRRGGGRTRHSER